MPEESPELQILRASTSRWGSLAALLRGTARMYREKTGSRQRASEDEEHSDVRGEFSAVKSVQPWGAIFQTRFENKGLSRDVGGHFLNAFQILLGRGGG